MPRAKVPPEQRQRAPKACKPCRTMKIRCDSQSPCSACIRKDQVGMCSYTDEANGRSSHKRPRLSSINDDPETQPQEDGQIGRLSSDQSNAGPLRPQNDPTTNSSIATLPSPSTSESPQSRLLYSGKLQKLHIGETASISYLQFLRQILRHRMGRCAFTESDFSDYMFESDVNSQPMVDSWDPPLDDKKTMIQHYLDATSGVLNLHTKAELDDLAGKAHLVCSSEEIATLSIVLAIGAQCGGLLPYSQGHSGFFARGQALVFEGMLSDPSEMGVRLFLLMAFYMLGACRRNTAFMYLGIAATHARALGLYKVEQYHALTKEERRSRLSCWKSLRCLDMMVNSILGRSSGLRGTPIDASTLGVEAESLDWVDVTRSMALKATFEIVPFMDELEEKGTLDEASAIQFLQRLRKWSSTLPEDLRHNPSTGVPRTTNTRCTLFIGATHVASMYYFAVCLATRPFLTKFLLPRTKNVMASEPTMAANHANDSDDSANLAQICLNSAMSLAKVGHSAMVQNMMPRNMCIMKAWMFAAGLLLGFASFALDSNATHDSEEAFHQANAVLKKLAEQSPLAALYNNILTSFWTAIVQDRRRAAQARRKSTNQFLDEIFTNTKWDEQAGSAQDIPPAAPGLSEVDTSSWELPSSSIETFTTPSVIVNDILGSGEDFSSASWENMTFDWHQPFATFVDSAT